MRSFSQSLCRGLSLICLLGLLAGCKVVAYSDLSESDINQMVALLRNNDVEAQKVSQGKGLWSLEVPDADLARALDTLQMHGLPRLQHTGLGAVFKKEGMVSTPVEEQARMLFALSEELSATISTIDGVLTARVHMVLPKNDNFGKKLTSATASVFIRHRSDVDLQGHIASIKKLIEHAVPDLQYDAIAVSLFPSEVYTQRSAAKGSFNALRFDTVSAALGAGCTLFIGLLCWFVMRKKADKKEQTSQVATADTEQ